MKLTTRCGSAAVEGLNEALLAKAAEAKLLRTSRLRADTTVVPANVAYPTDSRAAGQGGRGGSPRPGGGSRPPAARRGPGCGTAAGRRAGGRTRSRSRLRSRLAQGRDEKQAAVGGSTGELAGLAERAARRRGGCWPTPGGRCAAPRPRPRSWPRPARGCCRGTAARRGCAGRSMTWPTCWRPPARSPPRHGSGWPGPCPDGATRRVSLHDRDARPIAKGRLGRPVEFGYKAQVIDNDDGVILDHTLQQGNPPDGPQLAPAVERVIQRTGRTPRTVTADRGYGEQPVEDDLHALGVRPVVIPRKGKPGKARQAAERRRGVPPHRQVAHRQRRPHQHPQTRLRMGPHPPGQHRRSPDLDRTRGPGPQPGQDQRPGRLTSQQPGPQPLAQPARGTAGNHFFRSK